MKRDLILQAEAVRLLFCSFCFRRSPVSHQKLMAAKAQLSAAKADAGNASAASGGQAPAKEAKKGFFGRRKDKKEKAKK